MKDFQDYHELLEEFKKNVARYTQQGYWGKKFSHSLELNSLFYLEAFKANIEILPQVFEHLYNIAINHKDPSGFESLNKYQINKEALFEEEDISFLDLFNIEHKSTFEYLLLMRIDRKKPLLKTEEEKKQFWKDSKLIERRRYFWRFLKMATFLCAFYEYKLIVSKDPGQAIVKLNDLEKPRDPQQEYYLFYNRSHVEKAGIGIGKVTIINTKARVEYYYSADEDEAILLGKEYKTLKTTGRIESYNDSDILVLKNLVDAKNSEGNFKGPVESFFVLKKYRRPKENILLGINCSWNRSHHFPYATALLLIDRTYYDTSFTSEPLYAFEFLKKSKQYVPQAIYYYLFHQSISLQDVIDNNRDKETKKDILPFTELTQIPFSDEIPCLNQVIGKYQGYTIIFTEQREYLQVSQMEIFANGVVNLIINEEDKDKINDPKNKGYIKNVSIDSSDKGRLYINLRYNYGKHFNSLNIFLEFNKVDRSKPVSSREKLVLRGGYAGESMLTHRPISATVIFEEVDNPKNIVAGRTPILTKEGDFNPDIVALYKENKYLFDFFIHDHYNLFANDRGINLLKKRFAGTGISAPQPAKLNQYDAFISIPLTQNGDEETYKRNCRISMELRNELSLRYGFSKDRIFCASFFKEGCYSFKDYKESISIPKKIFEKVRESIDNSNAMFLVYPDTGIIDPDTFRISSSIVEIGYAMGRNKKIVILYDNNEMNRLPKNMIMLNVNNIFSFETVNETPIKSMFESRDNETEIRSILGLE